LNAWINILINIIQDRKQTKRSTKKRILDTYTNDLINEISQKLQDINLRLERTASELIEKKFEVERFQRKLRRIDHDIRQLKMETECVRVIGRALILDKNDNVINVDSTVEIANNYTKFSISSTKSIQSRKLLDRGLSGAGYDIDRFGEVTHIQRTRRINKVHFITDSGFETWRIHNNLIVYDGERGDINNETRAGKDRFYKSRTR